jgi:flavodoxin
MTKLRLAVMKKILIAYFSHSGVTRRAAEQIQSAVGGDLFEIAASEPYPRDYNTVLGIAKREIAQGYLPALCGELPAVDGYDVVFVGSPNWWSTIAPPVSAFLSGLDLTGKRIIPFITHGGGGLNRTVSDVRKLCGGAKVEDGVDATDYRRFAEYLKSFSP